MLPKRGEKKKTGEQGSEEKKEEPAGGWRGRTERTKKKKSPQTHAPRLGMIPVILWTVEKKMRLILLVKAGEMANPGFRQQKQSKKAGNSNRVVLRP